MEVDEWAFQGRRRASPQAVRSGAALNPEARGAPFIYLVSNSNRLHPHTRSRMDPSEMRFGGGTEVHRVRDPGAACPQRAVRLLAAQDDLPIRGMQ